MDKKIIKVEPISYETVNKSLEGSFEDINMKIGLGVLIGLLLLFGWRVFQWSVSY